MMRIKVPTTFTDDLLDALAPAAGRITLYGQRAGDPAGGGRPSLFLPDPSEAEFAAHLARAKALGFRFAYLMNAPCTGGVEATPDGARRDYPLGKEPVQFSFNADEIMKYKPFARD